VTFDELFAHHRLAQDERAALVHHLASQRYRRTVQKLRPRNSEDICNASVDTSNQQWSNTAKGI
jgi:hypothetical protein